MLSLESTATCMRTPIIAFAIDELGIACERIDRPAGYFVETFHTLGPRLVDGELSLFEPETILRHLARTRGGGTLMPADPVAIAQIDRWMDLLATTFRPAAIRLMRVAGEKLDERVARELHDVVQRCLRALESQLDGRDHLLGNFSVADCPALAIAWLQDSGCFDFAPYPNVRAYLSRLQSRPAWRRVSGRTPEPRAMPAATGRTSPAPIDAACAEWIALLGADSVQRDPAALAHAARTTLASAPGPIAILSPTQRDQVAGILRIAARHRVPVHPISTGRNWGWGDACPVTDGQVLLDLRRLDRIVAVDLELGYAVVEPGVTQGALAACLEAHGGAWWPDLTGAGPDTSVLGNALERGLSHGMYGDRFASVCGIEVVLADGSVVRTGHASHPDARTAHVHRWGVGPVLDGLFTQSNLGVVTEIGIWLAPKPPQNEMFYIAAASLKFPALVDRLRPLRLRGVLPTNVHAFCLPTVDGPPVWIVPCALYGTEAAIAASRAELSSVIEGIGNGVSCPSPREIPVDPASVMSGLGLSVDPRYGELINATAMLATGQSVRWSPEALLGALGGPMVQNTTATPTAHDPRDAGYGLYFAWLTCPATERDVRALVDLSASKLMGAGFLPMLALQMVNGRSCVLVVRIAYDRKNEALRNAARQCHRELLEAAAAVGYPPCRMGIDAIDTLDPDRSTHWQLVRQLKAALDPKGIIAPGRYCPAPGARPAAADSTGVRS